MHYQSKNGLRLQCMILCSFIVAFFLTALPLPYWAAWCRPEWSLLILIYWLIYSPQQVGLTCAFVVGVCLDSLYGSALGVHSMALVITAYMVLLSQKTLSQYGVLVQMMMVLFFVLAYQFSLLVVYALLKQQLPFFWAYWAPAPVGCLLWPVIALILSPRQRQAWV